VVAIYIPYEDFWVDDVKFYLLDTLPEYLVLIIMVYPAMMARMGQNWPKATKGKDKGKDKGKGKGKDKGKGNDEGNDERNDEGNETGKDGGNDQGKGEGNSRYTGNKHGQRGADTEASVLDSAAEMPAGNGETVLDMPANNTVHK